MLVKEFKKVKILCESTIVSSPEPKAHKVSL